MKFEYQAKNQQGEPQVGIVEAMERDAALRILTANGLVVLSITEAKKEGASNFVYRLVNKVGTKDLMIFTRQFSTLLGASVPLGSALRTLAVQTKNPLLKETIGEIQREIDSGLSLSQAMEKYSSVFSEFYVNMVRSAEVTGRVDEVMEFLADYLEKQEAISSKVRNALIYPIFMVSFLFIVVMFMAVVVFPQIQDVFLELGSTIPLPTRIVIWFGQFLVKWWWAVIAGTVLLVGIFADYLRSKEGTVFKDELTLRIPLFSKLLKQMYVARFADSVGVLIKGGVAIVQALEITARTMGSAVYTEILRDAANDVRNGVLLSQALAKYPDYFPPLIGQMVAIGESTGQLEPLLKKVSAFYSREIDDLVGSLVELIQPILMLIIGAVVGALFASILMPVYSFVSTSLQ
ncbi:MAG: type II secretion system F family protein [Candidatus Colwellbacteria bacterium]|nr:type II secretion system F family protein [Candidatus Colwellbacteria bacterium]